MLDHLFPHSLIELHFLVFALLGLTLVMFCVGVILEIRMRSKRIKRSHIAVKSGVHHPQPSTVPDRETFSNVAVQFDLTQSGMELTPELRGDSSLDPLTFMLTVAAGVLSTIISKLGERPASVIPAQDIRQLVSVQVRQGSHSQFLMKGVTTETITGSVIDEVYELAKRDEDLVIESGDLRLRREPAKPEDLIAFQIAHLSEIVAIRRVELNHENVDRYEGERIYNQDSEHVLNNSNSDSKIEGIDGYEWIKPEAHAPEGQGDRVIREMHERIRNRRSGGDR